MLPHHEVTGDGPAVLLIHAGVADSRMWDAQVPALVEAGHRVIRIDLRGFGRSDMPPGAFSLVQDVVDVLDATFTSRTDVIAASFGALVALRLATAHPDRVDRLILLSPNVPGVEDTPDFERFAAREEELVDAGDLVEATELNVDTWLGPEADDDARELVREMQRLAYELQLARPDAEPDDPEPDPAAVVARTLVVTGDPDLEFFRRAGDHLEATMPNVRRIRLAWAGHLPTLERPEEMTALLVDTLR